MDFVVDKVSEDSFYENLLIGLPKVLEKLQNVSDLYLERSQPVPHNQICAWEQKYGVLLSEDLRNFYASTNGLLYTYTFHFKESSSDEDKVIGKIDINRLEDLAQVFGYEICSDPGVKTESDRYELKLGSESKVFEIVNLQDIGRVVLVYINPRYLPTIWIQNASMKFYFIADDFTTYLKMAIHHLGIPFWQFSFTSEGLPEWSQVVFRLLAPAILPQHKKLEDIRRNSGLKIDEGLSDIPLNKIDCNIFKSVKTQQGLNIVTNLEQTQMSPRNLKKKPGKSKNSKTQKKISHKK